MEGNFSRTTFDARLSVYPFGVRNAFFIAGGLSFGGEKLAKLSGYCSEVARLYSGRLVPKNRVGFRIEAGCQFMGKIKVYQDGQELNAVLNEAKDDDLSKIIDKWSLYPVLRLTLTGRIL